MSEETKETMKETTTTEATNVTMIPDTKKTWVNRIWSAVVGAAVAIGAMFGITNEQIATEKAKVTSVKSQVMAALDALKAGDVTTATANLQAVMTTGKEVVADVKRAAEQVKKSDKNSIIESAKKTVTETLVKDQVKKVETAIASYTSDTLKKIEEKKVDVKTTSTNLQAPPVKK